MGINVTTDRILEFLNTKKLTSDPPRISAIAVTSLDGRATLGGVSGGLGNPLDARIFNTHRALSDAVFVGTGTIEAEEYGRVEIPSDLAQLREKLGKATAVPITTISRRLSLDPNSTLFRECDTAPIIFTATPLDDESKTTWTQRREALEEAGAKIVEVLELSVATAIEWLKDNGYRHVSCEGGPRIYQQLLSEQLVTDLFLTLSPWWVGTGPHTLGNGGRSDGDAKDSEKAVPSDYSLADSLISDSHIFLHYFHNKDH